jgi:superfamily II DNA/RNA helicase
MVPTRELVIQVSNVFESIKHADEFRVTAVYGGSPMEPQVESLRRGGEIVVGTTGRLMDHLERGTLNVSGLRCVILDEADRMLDMGFQEDVEKIFEHIRGTAKASPAVNGKPANGSPQSATKQSSLQCLLFSATFPVWVQRVSGKYLDPAFTLVDLVKNLRNKTVSCVKHLAVFCPYFNRTSILADISTHIL